MSSPENIGGSSAGPMAIGADVIPVIGGPAPVSGLPASLTAVAPRRRFAALDFETADYGRDSACAVSLVIVEGGQIVETWTRLIRPPRRSFVFTYLHGISWNHVRDQPSFGELWGEACQRLQAVDFIAAHNAAFDRSVLRACCEAMGLEPVKAPFVCTVRIARTVWNLHPASLDHVCRHLGIPLNHHNAESDAGACARILLAALSQGHEYERVWKTHALRPARR